MSAAAVVYAYHDVGVRCLAVLLAHGVRIPLVVTHHDDPRENVWFASVERLAREHDLEVALPGEPNAPDFVDRVRALAPDFLFSFYYRHLLGRETLACARHGAFNMHGSLLPRYRGRAPVNWAVLNGERETGATLHEMVEKPDAGRIVGQMAVPILADDVALDVFRKVTVAAEIVLDRELPRLLDGSARLVPQDLAQGSYYGGRKPEDGRIDWSKGAKEIHDLVRAVAPPYPGATTQVAGKTLRILRTRILAGAGNGDGGKVTLGVESGRLVARCADGGRLQLLECELDSEPLLPQRFRALFGPAPVHPESSP